MPEPDDAPLLRFAPATVQGRYLVRRPRSGSAKYQWIGFHGQGQTAADMLEPFASVPRGDDWLVVSVQGLHTYYAGRNNAVVANWMTRLDREHAIASNVAYVDTVVDQLEREFGASRARVFGGFSQGVAMAYRAARLGRHGCDAIFAAGGDVPPELMDAAPRPWSIVLAMTGEGDEFYTPVRLAGEVARLVELGADARARTFEGGHEWSGAVVEAAGELLSEVEAKARG